MERVPIVFSHRAKLAAQDFPPPLIHLVLTTLQEACISGRMKHVRIGSVKQLVDDLGGPKAAGEILGTTPQNIVNWRAAGKIPARFHMLHRKRLSTRGYIASDSCWAFVEAAEEATE